VLLGASHIIDEDWKSRTGTLALEHFQENKDAYVLVMLNPVSLQHKRRELLECGLQV
jgi:hypothetical protein